MTITKLEPQVSYSTAVLILS